MAIKCTLSLKNGGHMTTLSNESMCQDLQTRDAKLRRLSTFGSTNTTMYPTLSKSALATHGFRYIGMENKIECEACSFEGELSMSDKDLFQGHIQASPECQFVLKQRDSLSTNDQLTLPSISNSLQNNDSDLNCRSDINQNVHSLMSNTDPQKLFFNLLSDESRDKLRTNTFSNWPLITPNIKDMAAAGWCFTNIADRVICVYCNALFHNWSESDRPYEIHRLKSPTCPFVLLAEQRIRVLTTENVPIITELSAETAVGPVNTSYALAIRRSQSFQTWPHSDKDPLPSVDSFVDSGFFYTGDKTIVRCFYCNGALRNWQATDDPKVEHARWYPRCAYIRQYIGEDLYEAIQRKNRELKALQNYQDNSNTQNPQLPSWTTDEIERMTKARLDLPIVAKLRDVGFTMAIIRKTFEMQLKFKKDDFETDNDLRLACLILDQQVKLINGNESILLIPQEWLKKYMEDQAQGIQQIESREPQTVQSQVNKTEIPKIIVPVVPRPLIQKSAEDALPCVLCLSAERQIACLPCGHLTSCVACGHSVKTCPICRATVKAYVRIYV